MWTRRRFLASAAVILSPGRVARPFGAAGAPVGAEEPVRLHVIGEDAGATLALDEMSRTASLLGRALERSPHEQATIVDLRDRTASAAGTRYMVAASEASRSAALAAWRRRGAASAEEWHHALEPFGAAQLNDRFTRRFGAPMSSLNWMSWMLVKLAVDAQLRSVSLDTGRFDGHKGVALVFGSDRHLVQPLCMVDGRGALLGLSHL